MTDFQVTFFDVEENPVAWCVISEKSADKAKEKALNTLDKISFVFNTVITSIASEEL